MSEQDPTTPPGLELPPGRDAAADPQQTVSDDQLPAADHVREQARNQNALSRLVLAVIAFTVIDAVIIVVYIALWAIDFNFLLKAFEGRGWISLLFSAIPLILGAVVVQRNKNVAVKGPATTWAKAGMIVGALTGLITLAVPIVATIEQMVLPFGE